jgi:hypothetical protein
LSGVDVRVTSLDPRVTIDVIEAGAALGDDSLIAVEAVAEDGESARIAFARRGESAPEDADADVAIVLVSAEDVDLVREYLAVSLEFTDAGLTLHGPIDAPLD